MQFCPIPKIENSEISEICLFLQILAVVINQDLKTTKIRTEWKTERFQYDLKKKKKILRFPSFRFYSTPKIKNSEILESFILLQLLVVYETQYPKTKKKTWGKRNITLWCGLIRKIWKFPRFPSFRFGPMNKIENSEISESFRLL